MPFLEYSCASSDAGVLTLPASTLPGLTPTSGRFASRRRHTSITSLPGSRVSSMTRAPSLARLVSLHACSRSYACTDSVFFFTHRRRVPSDLPDDGKAHLQAAPSCLCPHLPRPLPADPPPLARGALECTLRPLPRLWQRVRPSRPKGSPDARRVSPRSSLSVRLDACFLTIALISPILPSGMHGGVAELAERWREMSILDV